MRLLLTGVAGFAGSHIAEHVLATTDWDVVGLASFRHRGCPTRLRHLDPDRVTILHADLTAPIGPRLAAEIGAVDYVINAAAESHVERSITDPRPFVENNVAVALTMLEFARQARPRVFLQVSTDEVYGPATAPHKHREWEPVIPSNPYSASKAAQEAIAISYWRTFGVPVVLTNTMNLVGEKQDLEKYVPTVIRAVQAGMKVPIHRQGKGAISSRHWLHARNHADALLFLLRRPPAMYPDADRPDRWHIAGEEFNALEVAEKVAAAAGKPLHGTFVDVHTTRPGHDLRYALDSGKIAEAGWTPPLRFDESLAKTVRWTLAHPEWLAA